MSECLICHERPIVGGPDSAVCGVCMLADLRRIMEERNMAERARAVEAARADAAVETMQNEARLRGAAQDSLAAANARAEKAVAEIVNEQRRFGEVQREAWKLEEALAAARRECEGLRKALDEIVGATDDDIAEKIARAALSAPAVGDSK